MYGHGDVIDDNEDDDDDEDERMATVMVRVTMMCACMCVHAWLYVDKIHTRKIPTAAWIELFARSSCYQTASCMLIHTAAQHHHRHRR